MKYLHYYSSYTDVDTFKLHDTPGLAYIESTRSMIVNDEYSGYNSFTIGVTPEDAIDYDYEDGQPDTECWYKSTDGQTIDVPNNTFTSVQSQPNSNTYDHGRGIWKNNSTVMNRINSSAFSNNTRISGISLPKSIASIGENAFNGCTSLEIPDLCLPNLTSINRAAFYGAKISKISSLGLVTSLTNDYASYKGQFQDMQTLESAVLPETLKSIGIGVFRNCSNLKTINFPILLTTIKENAFSGCTSLDIPELYLPNLTSLGKIAFYGTKIHKITSLGQLTSITNEYVSYNGTFQDMQTLESVVLPETLSTIGYNIFRRDSNLKTINFPISVSIIRESAFNGCTSLEIPELYLPNLTSLGKSAFYGTKIHKITSLGQITALPESSSISASALFMNIKTLESVVLPETLTSIQYRIFYGCSSLQYVYIKATTPPSLSSTSAFTDTNNCSIYVPSQSVDAYKAATNWSSFASRIQAVPSAIEQQYR